jgi:hypothetical protein
LLDDVREVGMDNDLVDVENNQERWVVQRLAILKQLNWLPCQSYSIWSECASVLKTVWTISSVAGVGTDFALLCAAARCTAPGFRPGRQ